MIVRELDLDAGPEEIFAALHGRRGSFFLDSAQATDGLGTHSFIGFEPFLVFRAKGDEITLSGAGGAEVVRGHPLDEMGKLFRRFARPADSRLPFTGGAVGYISYELCRCLERVGRAAADELEIPDLEFGFYDNILAFEGASGRAFIAAHARGAESDEQIADQLKAAVTAALQLHRSRPPAGPALLSGPIKSNFSREDYFRAVSRIKEYLRAGDVYQVNFTQRFEADYPGCPYELYRRLRALSPAPFSAYLNPGQMQIVSSSPERFLRLREGRVETRPIKGTRPRGATPEEDRRTARELVASEKDRAELLMIVDLERNDLGRVCQPGSIRVEQLYHLESHPTVHHLVGNGIRPASPRLQCDRLHSSHVSRRLDHRCPQDSRHADNRRTSGETRRRDLYTGAIGYLDFDGNCGSQSRDSHHRLPSRPRLLRRGWRDRGRLGSGKRVRGIAAKGPGDAAGPRRAEPAGPGRWLGVGAARWALRVQRLPRKRPSGCSDLGSAPSASLRSA